VFELGQDSSISDSTELRVLLKIFGSRDDLMKAYPEATKGDLRGLLRWAISWGVTIDSAKPLLQPHAEAYREVLLKLVKESRLGVQQKATGGTLMHYNFERFIIFRRVIFCDGWFSGVSSPSASIMILIDGRGFASELARVVRDDLRTALGPGTEHWGFRLRCILSDDTAEDSLRRVKLKLSDGAETLLVDAPAVPGANAEATELAEAHRIFFNEIFSHPNPKILEIGSRARSGVIRRDLFPEKAHYVGFDIKKGPNVDIVGDAHRLSSYVRERFNFVFCVSTFEHLLMPWKVAIEINRVLEPDGLVFVQSHQAWPVHDAPWDYWRFSKYAWNALFNEYTGFKLLVAAHSEPAVVLSALQTDNAATIGLGNEIGYLVSTCLARKVRDSRLSWEANPASIVRGDYPA
jgi:SAM-dependent methyltransferase